MITIVLADDPNIVRHGLKVSLSADPEFKVIGEANRNQLVQFAIKHGLASARVFLSNEQSGQPPPV